MVLAERIGLSTSPLPRECSTTELRKPLETNCKHLILHNFFTLSRPFDRSYGPNPGHFLQMLQIQPFWPHSPCTEDEGPHTFWPSRPFSGHHSYQRAYWTIYFLSYFCTAHLTKCLREKQIMLKSSALEIGDVKQRPLTVVEAMRELKEVRAVPIKVGNKMIWTRTDITGNAASLFRASGPTIPAKVLKTPKCSGTNRN